MTEPGLITKEGKERLLKVVGELRWNSPDVGSSRENPIYSNAWTQGVAAALALIESMPLITDPLDEERKKWGPRTRGGFSLKIIAMSKGILFGFANGMASAWADDGRHTSLDDDRYDLAPASPHADDAKWLREWLAKATLDKAVYDKLTRIADYIERGEGS